MNKRQLTALIADYPDDTEVRVIDGDVAREIVDVELTTVGVSFRQNVQVLGITTLKGASND